MNITDDDLQLFEHEINHRNLNQSIMAKKLPAFESITFEHAMRILFFQFCRDPKAFLKAAEDLMDSVEADEPPHKSIALRWYEQYIFVRETEKANGQ